MSNPQSGPTKAERRAQARVAAAAAAASAERTRRLRAASYTVAAVVLVVALIVTVALLSKSDPAPPSVATTPASAEVTQGITTIPSATYDAVGAGAVQVRPAAISAPALTEGGKPLVLYVGSEYCPFCAAQRWAVVAALSRFGTWSGLGATTSSSSDVFPSTRTLSFHGASYTSAYLAFSGSELQTNQADSSGKYPTLDTLNARDSQIFSTYDTTKYVGADGSIPFLDLGGSFAMAGASFSPALLTVDGTPLSWSQIASQLKDPGSSITRSVAGTANVLTAQLCTLTKGQPAAVCGSAGVSAAR